MSRKPRDRKNHPAKLYATILIVPISIVFFTAIAVTLGSMLHLSILSSIFWGVTMGLVIALFILFSSLFSGKNMNEIFIMESWK